MFVPTSPRPPCPDLIVKSRFTSPLVAFEVHIVLKIVSAEDGEVPALARYGSGRDGTILHHFESNTSAL